MEYSTICTQITTKYNVSTEKSQISFAKYKNTVHLTKSLGKRKSPGILVYKLERYGKLMKMFQSVGQILHCQY